MVKHYFLDVNIIPVDTVRDSDGLALSSRNIYLSKEQRQEALKIPKALYHASSLIAKGERDAEKIKAAMCEILIPLDVGYVAIVNREFKPLREIELSQTIILVEAVVGTTRLLDNIWL
jgi:pantoate--beta-alanine ligase